MTFEDIILDKSLSREKSRIRSILSGMKQRCYNPANSHYKRYGGRGIKICDEWMDPKTGSMAFLKWSVENGYMPSLSIDRINPNGDYCPTNCRWIPVSVNSSRAQRKNGKKDYDKAYTFIAKHRGEPMSVGYEFDKMVITLHGKGTYKFDPE